MSHFQASRVVSPKNRWKLKSILYDAGPDKIALASGLWDGKEALGIRWNGTNSHGLGLGFPNTVGHPTWFILPEEITSIILGSLQHESIWNSEFVHPDCVKQAIEELADTKNQTYQWFDTIKEVRQDTTFLCYKLILGGGPKPPLKRFLDLVRRVHKKNNSGIKEIITTDPYILADAGEAGTNGGYENLCLYLEAIGLQPFDNFTLTITPSPKRSENRLSIFKRKVLSIYPNATVSNFKPQLVFHDRIYLVRDQKSQLKGVFGPSLNGLKANDFVLMGEIENEGLRQLSRVFA